MIPIFGAFYKAYRNNKSSSNNSQNNISLNRILLVEIEEA